MRCRARSPPPGSYHFRDAWETIDHLLLGPGLFDEVGLSYAAGDGFAVIHDGLLDAGGTPSLIRASESLMPRMMAASRRPCRL